MAFTPEWRNLTECVPYVTYLQLSVGYTNKRNYEILQKFIGSTFSYFLDSRIRGFNAILRLSMMRNLSHVPKGLAQFF